MELDVFECTHKGDMIIANKSIACAVLNNGKRIITQTALFDIFNRTRKGEKRINGLPSIITAKNLLPLVSEELRQKSIPINYYQQNKKITNGYDAQLIPMICDLYIKANSMKVLHESQEKILLQINILTLELKKIDINSLIDEATGYLYDTQNNEFQELLKPYIKDVFLKWQERFPKEYYQELYKLYALDFDANTTKNPEYLARFTNIYIYNHLPLEIMEEVKTKTPIEHKGYRTKKHHQFLTGDIGIPYLEKHVAKIITIMQLSSNPEEFKINFNKVFNKNHQLSIDFD